MIGNSLLNIISIVLSPIIYWIPKKNNLLVFGAWYCDKYSDNTRYIFERVSKENKVTAIWITKNKNVLEQIRQKGLRAESAFTAKGIFYCIRASFAFYNCGIADINEFVVFGTKRIQLWHGVPLKKIFYDNDIQFPNNTLGALKKKLAKILRLLIPSKRHGWHLVPASTKIVGERMRSALDISDAQIIYSGYPRHEYLSRKIKSKPNTILYAPTLRVGKANSKEKFNELEFISGLDLTKLERDLSKRKMKFVIRLHNNNEDIAVAEKLKGFKHIQISMKNDDVYDLLATVKVLITDYSSIYLDFLVFNRPVIHYCFDLESYQKKERGLYEDCTINFAGPNYDNWNSVIEYAFSEKDNFRKKRLSLRTKYLGKEYKNGCTNIINHLLK